MGRRLFKQLETAFHRPSAQQARELRQESKQDLDHQTPQDDHDKQQKPKRMLSPQLPKREHPQKPHPSPNPHHQSSSIHHREEPSDQAERQLVSAKIARRGAAPLPPAPGATQLASPTPDKHPTPLPRAALYEGLHFPSVSQREAAPLPPSSLAPKPPSHQPLPTPTREAPTPLPPAALPTTPPSASPSPSSSSSLMPASPSHQTITTPMTHHEPSPLPPAALQDGYASKSLVLPPSSPSSSSPPSSSPSPSPVSLAPPPRCSHQPLATPTRDEPSPLPPAALRGPSSNELTLPPSPSRQNLPTPTTRRQPTPLPPAALSSSPQGITLPPSSGEPHLHNPAVGLPPSPSHKTLPTPHNHAQPTPLPPSALNSSPSKQLTLPPSPTPEPLPTPETLSMPTPLPPSALRSPHITRGAVSSLVTRTPPLSACSTSEATLYPSSRTEEEPEKNLGSVPQLSVLNVDEQKKQEMHQKGHPPAQRKLARTLRSPDTKEEDEEENEGDFRLPFKSYDPSNPQQRINDEKLKQAQIDASILQKKRLPSNVPPSSYHSSGAVCSNNNTMPVMGMAHPKYSRPASHSEKSMEEDQRKKTAYVTTRGAVGGGVPCLLAQDNRIAIEVEGDSNSLVHFDMGQAFAWDMLRKKQRITKEDYEIALKFQEEEEARIASEVKKQKEIEMSDAEFLSQQQQQQQQQEVFSNFTESLLQDLENGGFDIAGLESQQGINLSFNGPLRMSTADLTQSMMTEKWRELTDMRLAKNEREKDNIRTLLDLEIATKMAEGMSLPQIFQSMNPENKIWGMVENLRCFQTFSSNGRTFGPVQEGNKIYLPDSIRQYLDVAPGEQIHLEIVNPSLPNRQRYAGVIDFIDAVGVAVVPSSILESLKLDVGDVAQFCRIQMPPATKVTFKSEVHFKLEMDDLKRAIQLFSSFETGLSVTLKDFSGRNNVITCTDVSPESPATSNGSHTAFEVLMPEAGPQIEFIRVDVDGDGAEGWVEVGANTAYFVFNTDDSMANKALIIYVDAKIGNPDWFIGIDSLYPQERVEPQNLGPNNNHWSSSQAENGQIIIGSKEAKRKLGSRYFIAVKGGDSSSAFVVSVKTV